MDNFNILKLFLFFAGNLNFILGGWLHHWKIDESNSKIFWALTMIDFFCIRQFLNNFRLIKRKKTWFFCGRRAFKQTNSGRIMIMLFCLSPQLIIAWIFNKKWTNNILELLCRRISPVLLPKCFFMRAKHLTMHFFLTFCRLD